LPPTLVTSVDGTSIAVRVAGRGAPLVLLHGICADATSWLPVAGLLKDHYTVHSVDRRGRAGSGDGTHHSLDLEVEDRLAVLGLFDTPVPVLAHSYGATVTVLAAARTEAISRVVAYEPLLLPVGGSLTAVADRIDFYVEQQNRDRALTYILEQFAMPGLVDRIRAIPVAWELLMQNIHTVSRELRSLVGVNRRLDDLHAVECPVRLLAGTSSIPEFRASARAAVERLPSGELIVLQGQNHFATLVAPHLIANEVLDSVS